ncbi:hypothetical protein GLYMA_02G154900v4 [Glycine max]|uniref:Uncharacterized protein n=1 Tax=Glycine max TaxID=3847 RepID=K7K8J9_SOYBN|nr:hypothetical protein JHK85_004399 [Glycine max]KAH1060506.1 hypothetical protein GYH30_004125 [Glycine max]KRH71558.1 hypothetical protein GLYMA_02G154900v4 [Glycine max]
MLQISGELTCMTCLMYILLRYDTFLYTSSPFPLLENNTTKKFKTRKDTNVECNKH